MFNHFSVMDLAIRQVWLIAIEKSTDSVQLCSKIFNMFEEKVSVGIRMYQVVILSLHTC